MIIIIRPKYKEMMIKILMTIFCLVKVVRNSDPSCKSPSGKTVDWFIALKLNKGDEYAYCDAVNCEKIEASG